MVCKEWDINVMLRLYNCIFNLNPPFHNIKTKKNTLKRGIHRYVAWNKREPNIFKEIGIDLAAICEWVIDT